MYIGIKRSVADESCLTSSVLSNKSNPIFVVQNKKSPLTVMALFILVTYILKLPTSNRGARTLKTQ